MFLSLVRSTSLTTSDNGCIDNTVSLPQVSPVTLRVGHTHLLRFKRVSFCVLVVRLEGEG